MISERFGHEQSRTTKWAVVTCTTFTIFTSYSMALQETKAMGSECVTSNFETSATSTAPALSGE